MVKENLHLACYGPGNEGIFGRGVFAHSSQKKA
jgi:hypothetical protein